MMAENLPSSPFTIGYLAVGVALVLTGLYAYAKTAARRRSFPPGPKGWPVIGNINDTPPPGTREWEFWFEHKDKYVLEDRLQGPISSITVLGNTIVVVNSSELAFELLEKRSAIYNARPPAVFAMEMCGWKNALSGQTTRLREYRRRVFEVVGTKPKNAKFEGLFDGEAARFLLRVMNDPQDLLNHIRTEVGAIILKAVYGYNVDTTKRDPLVDIAEQTLEEFSKSLMPGAWLVDNIPILKYVPGWMPGAGFKKTAREYKANWFTLAEMPFKFARKQIKEKSYSRSFVSELYERAGEKASADDDEVIKWTAASIYGAGADTSVGVLAVFFLAMMTHPAVQAEAQQEIDRVVGRDRLPTYEDREKMPYVEALFKEAFRWHVIAPSALPHVCTKDDICEGYLIPKGSIIVPNVWWFAHDPAVYPRPEVFDPTRFLGPNPAPDPATYAFGFGRRLCPGKHFADLSIWLTLVRSLAVFEITKGRDEKGVEIEPEIKFTPGLLSHPVPYASTIKPRSPAHERLVRQVQYSHPEEEPHAAELEPVSV